MSKRITAAKFFSLDEQTKKNFMFETHLGFIQAWEEFGLDFPSKYWKVGQYSEENKVLHDIYPHNNYEFHVNVDKRSVVCSFTLHKNDSEASIATVPVTEDHVFGDTKELGCALFYEIYRISFDNYYTFLENTTLQNVVEFAVINETICDIEAIRNLAEYGWLSKKTFKQTYNAMKREFKHEQYSLRGLYGEEAKQEAAWHGTHWSMFDYTPKDAAPIFKKLLVDVQWKR